MATNLTPLLATARLAFGSLALLFPSPTLSLFRLSSAPIPGSALTTTRMFGIRDAVLGGLLLTTQSPIAVRRALIAGMVVDSIDVLIALYGVWNGDLEPVAGELVGGGAVVFLGCAGFVLWGQGILGKGMTGKG